MKRECFPKMYEAAKLTAKTIHELLGQKYGDNKYAVHLQAVDEVLRRFGYSDTQSSDLHRSLLVAAHLHDLVEDSNGAVTADDIEKAFGIEVADLVDAVTKVQDKNISKERRNRETIQKILEHPDAVILKLADRIANLEQGLKEGGIRKKYIDQYPAFKSTLCIPGQADEMWAYLDNLIENSPVQERNSVNI